MRCGTVLPKERVTVRGHWLRHSKRGWTISFNQSSATKLEALPLVTQGKPTLLASDVSSPALDDEGLPPVPFAPGIVMPDLREGEWDHAAFVDLLCNHGSRVRVLYRGRAAVAGPLLQPPFFFSLMCPHPPHPPRFPASRPRLWSAAAR